MNPQIKSGLAAGKVIAVPDGESVAVFQLEMQLVEVPEHPPASEHVNKSVAGFEK